MFKKILYPTDFSDVSRKAFEAIKVLKEAGLKEVTLLHVYDTRALERLSPYLDKTRSAELESRRTDEIRESLKEMEKELTKLGLKVTSRIEKGIPIREILRVEEKEKVSAIIIGSHGWSNLEEVFLGSVSEKVIRKAVKPVLVIKR